MQMKKKAGCVRTKMKANIKRCIHYMDNGTSTREKSRKALFS